MSKTRFTPWIVLACIGTLAGCTSGEDGTAGNTELNVAIPSGSSQSGPGAPESFDIEVVEYTIACNDGIDFNPTTDPDIDSGPTLNNDVTINGALEVLDVPSPGPIDPNGVGADLGFGPTLQEAYIWQGFMDLPPTAGCTVQLRARDGDGEVICTSTVSFDIAADQLTKVNVLMFCDISYQAPVGMLDLDGDFLFNVSNYCPDQFVLNCIDPDMEEVVTVPGLGSFAYTGCQVRFRDADSQCGDSCDPQTCVETPTGLDCTPADGNRKCDIDLSVSCAENGDADCPTGGNCIISPVSTVVTCELVDDDGNPLAPFRCAAPGPTFGDACDPTAADSGNGDCGLPPANTCAGGNVGATCDGSDPVQGNIDCGLPPPGGGIPAVCPPAVCAPASVQNCGGATVDPFCQYSGNTLGGIGDAPPALLATGEGGFLVGCVVADNDGNPDTPPIALAAGQRVRCTAATTDGDTDCDKEKFVDAFCPGLTPCQAFGGNAACQAASSTLCQIGTCNDLGCDGTAGNCCSYADAADGDFCDDATAPAECQSGVCTSLNCNAQGGDSACDDGNVCTAAGGVGSCLADGSCDTSAANEGGACASGTGSGDGSCEAGVCASNDACSVDGDCPDPGVNCQVALCNTGVTPYTCGSQDAPAGTACVPVGGGPGSCDDAGNCLAGCTVPAPVDAVAIPMACRNAFNQAVSTFPIDLLNVTPDDCVEDGQPVDFAIDPVIALDTAFLEAAAQTLCDLGTLLTSADVSSAQVSVDAIAGATCTETLSQLPGTPVTVSISTTCDGNCGDLGVTCSVTEGISLPLPAITVPCTAAGDADGNDVTLCSTGEVPLAISLTDPPPPPAYQQTYVGVNVPAGVTPPPIQVAFACNTSSTTNPPPGQANEIGCVLANPTPSTPSGQSCGQEVGDGNVGETPFPTSDCNTEDGPPTTPQTCDVFGNPSPCIGTCDTVPVGVDPRTVCATFTVQ